MLASVAAGELMAGELMASDFNSYAVGDVVIAFRKGGYDLVVDAGQISTLTSLSPNQRLTISAYTGTQLAQVGIDGVSWSAFTYQSDNTLYMTSARTSLSDQTAPWQAKNASSQHNTALRMATIPPGALDSLNFSVSPFSSATAVIEEDASSGNPNYVNGVSYHDALAGAYGGAFNGTFVGNPENTASNNFTTAGKVIRSDFYKLTPTGGYAFGQLLGYFELNTNGVMSYVAYPIATPAITSISRVGSSTTITYTAGLYGTYTLRGNPSLSAGTPPLSWSAVQTLVSGDTTEHSVTFTDTAAVQFYTITAQ